MQISSAFGTDAPNYAPTQFIHRITPNTKRVNLSQIKKVCKEI